VNARSVLWVRMKAPVKKSENFFWVKLDILLTEETSKETIPVTTFEVVSIEIIAILNIEGIVLDHDHQDRLC
jgi:hypothetical protein